MSKIFFGTLVLATAMASTTLAIEPQRYAYQPVPVPAPIPDQTTTPTPSGMRFVEPDDPTRAGNYGGYGFGNPYGYGNGNGCNTCGQNGIGCADWKLVPWYAPWGSGGYRQARCHAPFYGVGM